MPEETQELYRPVVTHPVTTDNTQKDLASRPFVREKPVISVNRSDEQTRHVVISKDAGRSLENADIGKKVIWGGELPGDIYGDTDQKGSRHGMILLERASYSKHWRVRGMAEYVPQVVEREGKASRFLRQNGLPTSMTREIHVITDATLLPDRKGKYFSLKKWKDYALDRLKRRLTDSQDPEVDSQVQSARDWLTNMRFKIEVRDMQVAERLRSLAYCKTQEEFERMIGPIFKWLNQATTSRDSGLITGTARPLPFGAIESDIRRYFLDWLPEQMGTYLGRINKLGVLHKNVTAQNWSAVGTAYDLDTAVGEPLGDPPVNSFALDINATLGALEELMGEKWQSYLSSQFNQDDLILAQSRFLRSYLPERYGEKNTKSVFIRKSIEVTYHDSESGEWRSREIPDEVWEKFAKLGVKSR